MRSTTTRSDLHALEMATGAVATQSDAARVDGIPESLRSPSLPDELLGPASRPASPATPALPWFDVMAIVGIIAVVYGLGSGGAAAERIGLLLLGAGPLYVAVRVHRRQRALECAMRAHAAAVAGYRMLIAPAVAELERHREALDQAHRLLHALPGLYGEERIAASTTSGVEPGTVERRYAERRASLERRIRESGVAARHAALRAWTIHEQRLPHVRESAATLARLARPEYPRGPAAPPGTEPSS